MQLWHQTPCCCTAIVSDTPPQALSRAMPWQPRSCRHSEHGPGGSSGREAFPSHSRHPSGDTPKPVWVRGSAAGNSLRVALHPRHWGAIVAHDRCQANGSRSHLGPFSRTRCPAPILPPGCTPALRAQEATPGSCKTKLMWGTFGVSPTAVCKCEIRNAFAPR